MQWSETETIDIHILSQTSNGKGTQTINMTYSKAAQAESQEQSSFSADGHQAILNKMNEKRQIQTESGLTLTTWIKPNRSTALKRSVTNYWWA